MGTLRIAWHLARADFLERVRRYSFLVTLAAAVWLGYLAYAGYIQMTVGRHRGVFNSAWTGVLMAMSAGLFVSFVGFYVVKSAIQRDRDTGVGQILASTRMPGWLYLIAKWLSNLAVLTAILLVLAAAAVALQLLRAEETRLDAWALLSPFLLLSLPAMALVAALALLFETLPGLRGGGGNVAYFFLWSAGISVPMIAGIRWADWAGLGIIEKAVVAAERAAFPGSAGEFGFNAGPLTDLARMSTFVWRGLRWTPPEILLRLAWLPLSATLVAVASLWAGRFDPARAPGAAGERPAAARTRRSPAAGASGRDAARALLRPLAGLARRSRPAAMTLAELRLALQGVSRWWYAGALGLDLAMLVAPLPAARRVLPYAWLWPVLLWSQMGVRERRHHTDPVLFSTPRPLRHQLLAVWLAGVAVALLTGGSLAVRLLLAGDLPSLLGWSLGALFIPSLALTLGVWSGTGKLFEALYVVLWYVGPAQPTAALDFTGASAGAAGGAPWLPAAILPLVALAALGRSRQLRR